MNGQAMKLLPVLRNSTRIGRSIGSVRYNSHSSSNNAQPHWDPAVPERQQDVKPPLKYSPADRPFLVCSTSHSKSIQLGLTDD